MKFFIVIVIFIVVCCVAIAPADAITEVHPSLIYTGDDVGEILARLGRDPYGTWLSQLQTIANQAVDKDISWSQTVVPKQTQAYYAKMMAAAYAFSPEETPGRDVWAAEAAEALSGIPRESDFDSKFDSDLELSEAVSAWAAAYDMLKGAGFDFVVNDVSLENTIRERFGDIRDYMARDWDESVFGLYPSMGWDYSSAAWTSASHSDNHHVKRYAALCMVSLAIYDRSGSVVDFDRARGRLIESLDNMLVSGVAGEGVWAEGPNYHLYSMNEYIPAFTAMQNAGYNDYKLFADLAQAHLSLPRMAMPDGYLPPIDDNEAVRPYMAGLLYSLYTELEERETLHWLWETAGRPMNTMFLPDYIARYDDGADVNTDPADAGWDPVGIYPESGFARLRNSWQDEGIYVLLQAEHGEARSAGQAHEHPDPGSFILHAYGELLMLDSGYGGWSERENTRYAENHNIILVNGEGPSAASQASGSFGYWNANGVDASIAESYSLPVTDYVRIETAYRDAAFQRHAFFPGRRYLILYDRISSAGNNVYTLLLHGNAGGDDDSNFAIHADGGVWSRDLAEVATYTTGTAPVSFGSRVYSHAVYKRSPMQEHVALMAEMEGDNAGYLTLVYPKANGDDDPLITGITSDTASGFSLARGDTLEYGVLSTVTEPMSYADDRHDVVSDGSMIWLSDVGGTISGLSVIEGSYFETDGIQQLWASEPISISLAYQDGDAVVGHVNGGFDTRVKLPVTDVAEVTVDGAHTHFVVDGDGTTFWVTGAGDFVVERTGIPVISPPAYVTVTDVPDDNGHQLDITWEPSPSENLGLVQKYRIYRSRTDAFGDVRTVDSFASLEDVIAWELENAVLVDSVSVGDTMFRDSEVPLNGVPYYYFVEAVGTQGASAKTVSGVVTGVAGVVPISMALHASPNPFNAAVTISYHLPEDESVRLAIYTITGQEAAVLQDGYASAGEHTVVWAADTMPSGTYVCVLESGSMHRSLKMTLLK